MNYSIIKVHGLSMKPFLRSNDLILVQDGHEQYSTGSCLHLQNNIHRLLSCKKTKGDRMVQYDSFPLQSTRGIVKGRVIKETPHLIVSNYHHPLLFLISRLIAFCSERNLAQNSFRLFFLALIIFLSSLHRVLENVFIIPAEKI